MQIEERTVGDVMVLDVKGRITLGEGDEILKDKVKRRPWRDCAHLHHREPSGWQSQAVEPDQAHHGSARDHEAADRVRDLRVGERSGPELLVGEGLVRLPR